MSSCATNARPIYVTYGKVSISWCDSATMGSDAVLVTSQAPSPLANIEIGGRNILSPTLLISPDEINSRGPARRASRMIRENIMGGLRGSSELG